MDYQTASKNNNKGFTLIEILIAIAIVAIIASVFVGNFFSSIARGRDSRRKQDLRSIAQGLELYYTDNGLYPTALPTPRELFAHPNDLNTVYMQELPGDPAAGKRYCYQSADGSSYQLYAGLENNGDSEILPTPHLCDGGNYNYGVSSTNTAP